MEKSGVADKLKVDIIQEAVALAEAAQKRLHEIPEDSFEEYKTTAVIREACEKEPVRLIDLGMRTGVIGFLEAGEEAARQRTILLRADIDAVPTPDGPLHRCGHDHHASSLIGALHYLAAVKENLPANVAFVFQPGEECTAGAGALFEAGLLKALPQKPCACFGIHNRPELPVGQVAVHSGPLMAAKNDFEVKFTGKTGHAGSPHHVIDPLLAGAAYVQAVQSVIPRNLDPLQPAVVGIYSFVSGDSSNDPPKDARLTGTFRSLDKAAHAEIRQRLEELACATAEAYRCGVDFMPGPDVPLLYNDPALYPAARRAAESVFGTSGVTDTEPTLASDDFAEFGERMPAFYYWLGSGAADGSSAPWHDPAFEVSEGYQAAAVPLIVESVFLFGEDSFDKD